jgi:hypothetical protein
MPHATIPKIIPAVNGTGSIGSTRIIIYPACRPNLFKADEYASSSVS